MDIEKRVRQKTGTLLTNVQYNDLVSQRLNDKKMKVIKLKYFCHVLFKVGFPMKAMLIKANSVSMHFRNHRYVAAQNRYQPSLEIFFSPLAAILKKNPGFPYF